MNRFHRWYCRTGRWRETVQQSLLPWVLRDADLGSHALEVGPGPGLTTDVLRTRVPSLTALEIDPALATSLRTRMAASNVTVVEGDGTAMPFADGTFTGAVSCTMLHHVPTPALQDRLLAEVRRAPSRRAVRRLRQHDELDVPAGARLRHDGAGRSRRVRRAPGARRV